jgi:hypothetical protein
MKGKTRSAKINEAISELIAVASHAKVVDDIVTRTDTEMRIRFLLELGEQLERRSRPSPEPSIFISYSSTTGTSYFKVAREIAESHGFQVGTGFDLPIEETTLRAVRTTIQQATLFLSIMTPEYNVRLPEENGTPRTGPSIWVVEEKGMALALNKPFRLLVDESVHVDFWKKTTPESLHGIFNGTNFAEKAEQAILALQHRYRELLISELVYPNRFGLGYP